MRSWFAACVCALGFAGAPAGAEVFVVQPGPEGQDVAPYSFIPTLNRGQHPTNYAFSGTDSTGVHHDFETFVKFPLPQLAPGSQVIEAYVWTYYAFDFTGFGSSNSVPGEIRCHEVLGSWTESSVTWNNRPAKGPALDVHDNITGLGILFCDVTDLVDDWLTGAKPNRGIAFTNSTARLIGMYSWEDTSVSANFKTTLVIETAQAGVPDADLDGVGDAEDNCPDLQNELQEDFEGDGVGDVCDVCPDIFDPNQLDTDGDLRGDACGFEAADLSGDGRVTVKDRNLFQAAIGKQLGQPGYREDCDLDGDEVITQADFALWEPLYLEFLSAPPPPPPSYGCGLLGIEAWAVLAVLARLRRRRHSPS